MITLVPARAMRFVALVKWRMQPSLQPASQGAAPEHPHHATHACQHGRAQRRDPGALVREHATDHLIRGYLARRGDGWHGGNSN